MKKLSFVLALNLMFGTASLWAAESFEGQVDYHVTIKGSTRSADIIYLIKKNKIRLETNEGGHQRFIIENLTTRQVTLLIPENKAYVTIDPPAAKADATPEGKMDSTGKTVDILGKSCEEWVYESPSKVVHVWAVPGMGNFMNMGSLPGDASDAWVDLLKSKGLFPLKLVLADQKTGVETTLEATQILKKSLRSSLFTPPKDYSKAVAAFQQNSSK